MLTGGNACLGVRLEIRKGSAPMPVLNASPIIRAITGISKHSLELCQSSHGSDLRGVARQKQSDVAVDARPAEYAGVPGLLFNAPPGTRWRSSTANGLSRPPKRLPYPLETSPSPVNRDYMGASSSWAGANHARNTLRHIPLGSNRGAIPRPALLPAKAATAHGKPPENRRDWDTHSRFLYLCRTFNRHLVCTPAIRRTSAV